MCNSRLRVSYEHSNAVDRRQHQVCVSVASCPGVTGQFSLRSVGIQEHMKNAYNFRGVFEC